MFSIAFWCLDSYFFKRYLLLQDMKKSSSQVNLKAFENQIRTIQKERKWLHFEYSSKEIFCWSFSALALGPLKWDLLNRIWPQKVSIRCQSKIENFTGGTIKLATKNALLRWIYNIVSNCLNFYRIRYFRCCKSSYKCVHST